MSRVKYLLFGHSTIPMEVYAVFYSIAWGIRAVIAEEMLGNIITPDRAFMMTYLRLFAIFVGILYGIVLLNHAQNLRRFMMGCLTIIWIFVFFLTLVSPAQNTITSVATSLVYLVTAVAFGWTFLRMHDGTIRGFYAASDIASKEESDDAFLLQVSDLRKKTEEQNESISLLTKEIALLLIRIKVLESLVIIHKD